MIEIRRGSERGHAQHGWLDSFHSFSFADYYDADHTGFGPLRVINEDRVQPGQGFGTHSHRDMEIISYVLEGALEHKDSMGTGSVIRPGEIQFMRAGTGVAHSEFNQSKTDPVHFLQIWIVPAERGLPPAYGQRAVDEAAARRGFAVLASPDGREDSLRLRQDVLLLLAKTAAGDRREWALGPGRHAWVHVARGTVEVNGNALGEGDGAAISGEAKLTLAGRGDGEVLAFDLA